MGCHSHLDNEPSSFEDPTKSPDYVTHEDRLDPREPFDAEPDDFTEQDWCDTCAGTPNSHVCLTCFKSISSSICERLGGFCGVECQTRWLE